MASRATPGGHRLGEHPEKLGGKAGILKGARPPVDVFRQPDRLPVPPEEQHPDDVHAAEKNKEKEGPDNQLFHKVRQHQRIENRDPERRPDHLRYAPGSQAKSLAHQRRGQPEPEIVGKGHRLAVVFCRGIFINERPVPLNQHVEHDVAGVVILVLKGELPDAGEKDPHGDHTEDSEQLPHRPPVPNRRPQCGSPARHPVKHIKKRRNHRRGDIPFQPAARKQQKRQEKIPIRQQKGNPAFPQAFHAPHSPFSDRIDCVLLQYTYFV